MYTENTFRAPGIKCAICGDSSHPTRDCVQKRKTTAESVAIDEEYNSFMQQLGEKPVISTATRVTPVLPTAAASAPAPAPWLQPPKMSAAVGTQPWMLKQSVGAPGTASAPPGMNGSVALGSTPATAYPPPVAPGAMYGGGYGAAQTQGAWGGGHHHHHQQWGAADYYYGAASAGAVDYQQQQHGQYGASTAAAPSSAYGHYGPTTGAAAGAGAVPTVPATAAAANGSAAGYYQYPQQQYYSSEPQQ